MKLLNPRPVLDSMPQYFTTLRALSTVSAANAISAASLSSACILNIPKIFLNIYLLVLFCYAFLTVTSQDFHSCCLAQPFMVGRVEYIAYALGKVGGIF